MTKRYGSFRGARLQAVPPLPPIGALGGSFEKRLAFDSFEAAASPAIAVGDKIWIGNISLEARLDPASMYYYDALGASTTLSVGDEANPAALAAAASTSSAGSRSLVASVDIADYPKPLWQQLGYASLDAAKAAQPLKNGYVDLYFTVGGAAIVGTLTWQLRGCDN